MRNIINKINNGDSLTDEELDKAIVHYSVLDNHLQHHGPLYFLVRKDVLLKLNDLMGYKRNRQK